VLFARVLSDLLIKLWKELQFGVRPTIAIWILKLQLWV